MGMNAGMAILCDGKLKVELLDRSRVFYEAFSDMEWRNKKDIVDLLLNCLNEAIKFYKDESCDFELNFQEFSYRIDWINVALKLVDDNDNCLFCIFDLSTNDFESLDDFKHQKQ